MQCFITGKQSDQITHYDETKKMAHDSQIVRAKENLKLSHGGPSQRQASGTNQRIKDTVVQDLLWQILNIFDL